MSRGSLIGITRLASWCRSVIPSDGFFYPHHTPMMDTFSCIPFNLPHLIFEKRICYKATLFPFKSFYSCLMISTLPATGVRLLTLTSNLLSDIIFDVTAVKTNVT